MLKRNIDLNKFDFNSIEKERYERKAKANIDIKKRDLSDKQIIKSISNEMITAINNWER